MASPPSTTPSGPPPPPPPPHSAALKIDPESTADVQSDLTLVDAALALGSPFAPESSKGGVGERRAEEERVKDRQITVLLDMLQSTQRRADWAEKRAREESEKGIERERKIMRLEGVLERLTVAGGGMRMDGPGSAGPSSAGGLGMPGMNMTPKIALPPPPLPYQPSLAMDPAALAAKYMPDLGFETIDSKVIHWSLKGWSQLPSRAVGQELSVGGYKWRTILFPKGEDGTGMTQPLESVSCYLRLEAVPKGGHACAQFAFVLANPSDPTCFSFGHGYQLFDEQNSQWGFSRFADLRQLTSCQVGQVRPVLERESDALDVITFVRILRDPGFGVKSKSSSK